MNWEQTITTALQSLYAWGGSFFDGLFACLTFLAEDTFLMLIVFLVYWCLNKKLGEYLMLALFSSMAANAVLKDLVRRPRPFLTEGYAVRWVQLDNGLVDTLSLGHSYSFPSGHSQCAGGLWTALALWFRKGWLWIVAAVAVVGVMASRVYLGVHFPADVLVGAALGISASLLCGWLFERFYSKRLWLFVGVVALMLPALLLEPTVDTAKTLGVGIGAVTGLWWEHRSIRFGTEDPTLRSILLRILLGGALVLQLKLGLALVLPHTLLGDGLRYAVVGLAATGVVPWLFVRLRL